MLIGHHPIRVGAIREITVVDSLDCEICGVQQMDGLGACGTFEQFGVVADSSALADQEYSDGFIASA